MKTIISGSITDPIGALEKVNIRLTPLSSQRTLLLNLGKTFEILSGSYNWEVVEGYYSVDYNTDGDNWVYLGEASVSGSGPRTIQDILGIQNMSDATSISLSAILDLSLNNIQDGQILQYSGGLWVNQDISGVTVSPSASYIDYSDVDNVPDFVLESETSSMSVGNSERVTLTDDYSNINFLTFSENQTGSQILHTNGNLRYLPTLNSVTMEGLTIQKGGLDITADDSYALGVISMNLQDYNLGLQVKNNGTIYFREKTNMFLKKDLGEPVELYGTSSWAEKSIYAVTASYALNGGGGSSESASYAETAGTASYIDYENVAGAPGLTIVGNGTVTISAGDGLKDGGDFSMNQSFHETITLNVDSTVVRTNQTSSMNVESASYAATASHILNAENFESASYIDFSDVDNVPDFVLESETSSMSVESSSHAQTVTVSEDHILGRFVLGYEDDGKIKLSKDDSLWQNTGLGNVGFYNLTIRSNDNRLSFSDSIFVDVLFNNNYNSIRFLVETSSTQMVADGKVIMEMNADGLNTSASFFGTSSYSLESISSSFAESSNYAVSASHADTAGGIDYSNVSNTPTIGNATITISGGDGLQTGGNFTTNQTGNETITLNVDSTVVRTSQTSSMSVATASHVDTLDDRMLFVNHGSNPNHTRPNASIVYWVGSVEPLSASNCDMWCSGSF